ncbi:proteinrelated to RNA-binding protein cabeza [Beauveria brongniartii RCEF 3172]|uniref:Proteinrelated to RNA-binding protein cabeza n=1 Tax=Beauveria brongniartii RCEF 3172 TaxID=1081107 RepID=A0A167KYY5_9HYPO|nr:proteinrelated to RNA-binding protein cabeza [Beauveria brongniartii RCEF 3172]
MGVTPVKKTPSKTGRSPAQDRRSQARVNKDSDSATTLLQTTQNHNRETSFSHSLPTEVQKRNNGRVVGRSLIMWGRPRMAEKLLLHLHYECTRHKIVLPWDSIAHRLRPGSSGAAVVQHLNRVRKELIREGHLVPPVCQKPSSTSGVDPSIRGFVRQDPDGDDKDTTRPVRFDEKYDDLRFNLPDSFQHSGDEDECMPESPSPVRMQQPMFCSGPPSATDESVTNSLRRFEQSWSPQSSYCSPTRQQRSEIDELENPLLTRSFDTVTSAASAPTSAPNTQAKWQEAPFPQYSPMGLYPYQKQPSTLTASFSGYFTLPSNYSMFTNDESFATCQEEPGMQTDFSQILSELKQEDEPPAMAVDENFIDACDIKDSLDSMTMMGSF